MVTIFVGSFGYFIYSLSLHISIHYFYIELAFYIVRFMRLSLLKAT